MKIGVYPGSFDPTTNGHIDVITRSSHIVDKLIVGVLHNTQKQPLFSVQERIEMLKATTSHLPNVQVETFSGLLIDFVKKHNAILIIRGLRAITDFEYELQMAQTNYSLDPTIETIFLATNVQYSFLSSSMVKELAEFGGHFEHFVPPIVAEYLVEKFKKD
ncbi:MAG: pantetheine-phosphate adenylyltransferase [Epulopiscium sp.]|nr:pantetheine-phosphate adenylyltransferase [Candidatus Epulonipiscium sp.]